MQPQSGTGEAKGPSSRFDGDVKDAKDTESGVSGTWVGGCGAGQ